MIYCVFLSRNMVSPQAKKIHFFLCIKRETIHVKLNYELLVTMYYHTTIEWRKEEILFLIF